MVAAVGVAATVGVAAAPAARSAGSGSCTVPELSAWCPQSTPEGVVCLSLFTSVAAEMQKGIMPPAGGRPPTAPPGAATAVLQLAGIAQQGLDSFDCATGPALYATWNPMAKLGQARNHKVAGAARRAPPVSPPLSHFVFPCLPAPAAPASALDARAPPGTLEGAQYGPSSQLGRGAVRRRSACGGAHSLGSGAQVSCGGAPRQRPRAGCRRRRPPAAESSPAPLPAPAARLQWPLLGWLDRRVPPTLQAATGPNRGGASHRGRHKCPARQARGRPARAPLPCCLHTPVGTAG